MEQSRSFGRAAKWTGIIVFLVFLVALGVSWAGAFSRGEPEVTLADAEQLCLDEKWGEARVLLKEYLLSHPNDAGAHYYLGRCYLVQLDRFIPYAAEGEFQLALQLSREQGGASPIPRFSDEYFEMMCNIDSAKVFIRWIYIWLDHDYFFRDLADLVDVCRKYVDRAREIRPDAPEVKQMDDAIVYLDNELPSGPRPAIPDVGQSPA